MEEECVLVAIKESWTGKGTVALEGSGCSPLSVLREERRRRKKKKKKKKKKWIAVRMKLKAKSVVVLF